MFYEQICNQTKENLQYRRDSFDIEPLNMFGYMDKIKLNI